MKNYNVLLSNSVWKEQTKPALLSKIKNPKILEATSMVLENTRRALLADTQMNNLVYLPKLNLPLVMRVFPNLIAHNIVSVQPTKAPLGMIRFLDIYREGSPDTIVYPWNSTEAKRSHSTEMNANHVTNDTISGDPSSVTTFTDTITNEWAEGTLFVYYVPVGGGNSIPIAQVMRDGTMRQLVDNVGGTAFSLVGAVNSKTKVGTFSISANIGSAGAALRWDYFKNWEKVIPFGSDQTFNKLKFDITSRKIETRSRKLGASYSYETVEDYQSEFGDNFEDKVVDALSQVINTEIDSEILYKLWSNASLSDTWDSTMPSTWTRGIDEWYKTIMPKIEKLSATIFQATHISGATFMVMSPKTAAIFQSFNAFMSKGSNVDSSVMGVGTLNLGTVNNRYDVYVTPLVPDNQVLLGFNGKTPEATGAIYAPYVPIKLVPVTYAEMPTIQARTRYAFEIVRPDFYAILNIAE